MEKTHMYHAMEKHDRRSSQKRPRQSHEDGLGRIDGVDMME